VTKIANQGRAREAEELEGGPTAGPRAGCGTQPTFMWPSKA